LTLVLLGLLACINAPSGQGHSHGHGHGGAHAHDDDAIAITRWTDAHELFVEIDAPIAGQRFAYHAHVTRLADNRGATSGVLTLTFEEDGFAVESHADPAVVSPGVFSGHATAPAVSGRYLLRATFIDADEAVSWEGATVEVGDGEPGVHPPEPEGEISFRKEAQWQIPFAVMRAGEVSLASDIRAPAMVESAPASTILVAAPVSGLLAWSDEMPVVGREVTGGERLAMLIPAGEAEHWGRLQADLATARVDRELADKELARVEDLVNRELLSERRLEEARAQVERSTAEISATSRRVSALTSRGTGAVAIRAPADGMIVSVGAHHGVSVAAGDPLVSVSTGPEVLIEGHVHNRSRADLSGVASLTVMRGDWDAPRDLLAAGGRVLGDRLVFDPQTLSAPIHVLVERDMGLAVGDLVELHVGVGERTPRLAVPRSAVVEINGRDVLFVQKTGESFTRRRVTVGASDAAHVEILSGLEPGERVVVEGGFDVHVASLSGALESHRH
jgi:RND family efflux transporter MFP subunit